MKHAIQICHPNEMIEGKWKSVGFVASREEIKDVISYPDFEIYNGLLFRCGSFACFGAFSNDRFLDLGSESKLMNKLRDAHLYGITKSTNFMSFWRDIDHPASLCGAIKLLMTREYRIRLHRMCATMVRPYILPEFHHLIDSPVLTQSDAERELSSVRIYLNDYTEPQRREAFHCLFTYLFSIVRSDDDSHTCLLSAMRAMSPYRRDYSITKEAKTEALQRIRAEFSFHEVIQCVLNSDDAIRG